MSKPGITQQAYRFVLAPSSAQILLLVMWAGASRFWFNQALALVKARLDARAAGEDVDVPWSYKGLCVNFSGSEIKDEIAPWRTEVPVGAYQAGLEGVGKALQNFSRGRAEGKPVGFPRFRAKGRSHEAIVFQRPRIQDARHLGLHGKLGPIKTKESMHKLIRLLAKDPNARILRSTVQYTGGQWVISINVERSVKIRPVRQPNTAVGMDLGLTHLATLSTGETFENARPLGKALRQLRHLQRQADRQRRANNPGNYGAQGRAKRGCTWHVSNRQVITDARIVKLHARVANQRREQAHLLTSTLTREFGVIGAETLAVKNLVKNKRLARHISDVGWGMIMSQLEYKTQWSNSTLVRADRYYPSSKTCSECGIVRTKLSLSERVFTCESTACEYEVDRDVNAAINLAQLAMTTAQAEGIKSYVARTGRFTKQARGGHVSLVDVDQQPPRETRRPTGSSRHGDMTALDEA